MEFLLQRNAAPTLTMSSPPTSSPLTYSWGYVGQLEKDFSPWRTWKSQGELFGNYYLGILPLEKAAGGGTHRDGEVLLPPRPPGCQKSRNPRWKKGKNGIFTLFTLQSGKNAQKTTKPHNICKETAQNSQKKHQISP